jgi:hypothetical protein
MCWTNGKKDYVHRAVWFRYYGPIPAGWQVHHIDGNRMNNSIDNLICMSHEDHEAVHKGQVEIIERYRAEVWKR